MNYNGVVPFQFTFKSRMSRNFASIAFLTVISLSALTAGFGEDMGGGPKGPSVIVAPVAPVTVQAGKSASLEMNFRVAQGYHINSNQPKDEFLLPTQLKLDAPTDIVLGKVTYPQGKDYSFSFSPDQKLNVYSGDFAVHGTVRTTRSISPGTYRVHGTLNYQACDNAACYPPKRLPVTFDVHVVKATRTPRRNPGQSPHVH